MRKNPLTRSYRVDKLTLAALEATLALYRDPARAMREIPALAQLTAIVDDAARARRAHARRARRAARDGRRERGERRRRRVSHGARFRRSRWRSPATPTTIEATTARGEPARRRAHRRRPTCCIDLRTIFPAEDERARRARVRAAAAHERASPRRSSIATARSFATRTTSAIRDDVELLPGAAAAIRRLNERGHRRHRRHESVGNRARVAHGRTTTTRCARGSTSCSRADGARIDATYMCPHHPGHHRASATAASPGSALYRARDRRAWASTRAQSLFIGDRMARRGAGRALGGRGISARRRVDAGGGSRAGARDAIATASQSLGEAVDRFLARFPPRADGNKICAMRSRIAVLASGGGSNLQAILEHFDRLGDRRGGDVVLVASDRTERRRARAGVAARDHERRARHDEATRRRGARRPARATRDRSRRARRLPAGSIPSDVVAKHSRGESSTCIRRCCRRSADRGCTGSACTTR